MTFTVPFRIRIACVVLASLALAGCEHADPLEVQPAAPSFSSIQQNVFAVSCAVSGCHLGGSAAAQLDLSASNAYSDLVGVASVEVPTLLRV
ncbi:MAG: hypothetical protein R3178_09805, partial [Rhodothermales bacterium]|nr:hypothetical protein [Rhodothermales bacterium]